MSDTGVMQDPLAGSPWSRPETVAGFSASTPNLTLMDYAARAPRGRLLDIGCGAGRNAVPLSALGWQVLGLDLSWPMLLAAARRVTTDDDARSVRLQADRLWVALAPMESLPVRSATIDLIVAHGIWNLASSGAQFRAAVREAARVARSGARLFVFTFSRNTLPPGAPPVAGESFVFTQFSGEPQCFLTIPELHAELAAAGFTADPALPTHELNSRPPGVAGCGPVILEGGFLRA